MSDYICFDLQKEIIKRLPVKSLVRFRTVSKPWKSLIDSSEFMADYTHHHEPLVLISYKYQSYINFKFQTSIRYLSLLDHENFSQHYFPTSAPSMSLDEKVGCSHGLFCFYSYHRYYDYYGYGRPDTAVLWNPAIRKTFTIDIPNENNYGYGYTCVGFGVCRDTFDPMLVKITRFRKLSVEEYIICWKICVFTLSSRVWKHLICNNLPRSNIQFAGDCVDIDGFIYWRAYKRIFQHGPSKDINLVMSFDLKRHEFKEIYLPGSLANKSSLNLAISKLRESIVVLEYHVEVAYGRVCDVWMMTMDDHHGVQNLFTKLYTIKSTDVTSIEKVLGFTNNGEPINIIEKRNDAGVLFSRVAVYEKDSQQMHEIGDYEAKHSLAVHSYKETLLMLNQPDYI